MKTYAMIGMASVFGAQAVQVEQPEVEGIFDIFSKKTPEQQEANTKWYIEGAKGYYDGYYKSFYKTSMDQAQSECLNDETMTNIVKFGKIASNPFSIFTDIANISEDFNLFAEGAEILENVSKCHFEQSAFDIMHMCSTQPDDCKMNKLIENLTKNMFVLMGKITSLAESLKDFPAEENEDFKEQMREFGSDFGTFMRVIFNYQTHHR